MTYENDKLPCPEENELPIVKAPIRRFFAGKR